ncbi:MAG TPA: FkbM family methyltransferase [Verrucomicrobiae bacterium]|nr:FkbM family methyltransferase [Verrucomicrobiae bacterium]
MSATTAQPPAEKKSFLHFLDSLPLFHVLVRTLRLRQLAGAMLRMKPRVGTLPKSGARYRCRYLETILLADELFKRNVYLEALAAKPISTFVDLGCNVGLFPVLLTELTGRRDLRGLLIDANPQMVEEATWHAATNDLKQVIPVFGLAGAANAGQSVDFYLLPSNLGSSQFPVYEPGKPQKGAWKKVTVPCVDVETLWVKQFGDVRCDILKMDIEGSEKTFLETDKKFLQRVDAIILEWHKWIVTREQVEAMLTAQGFKLVQVLEELGQTGIAWYRRS